MKNYTSKKNGKLIKNQIRKIAMVLLVFSLVFVNIPVSAMAQDVKASGISISVTADDTTPAAGQTINYTYTITNTGTDNLTDVILTDYHVNMYGDLVNLGSDQILTPSETVTVTKPFTVPTSASNGTVITNAPAVRGTVNGSVASDSTQYNVTVENKPTSITASPTEITAEVNDTGVITASVLPADTNQEVTYTSDDKSIITVSAAGEWTAKAPGTTTIKVKTSNNITTTVGVTVQEKGQKAIVFQGADDWNAATVSLDHKAKEFRVNSADQTKIVNDNFPSQYFSLELYTAADPATPVLSSSVKGAATPASFVNTFNGAEFEYGDILRVTHKEPQTRLDVYLQGSNTATNKKNKEQFYKITKEGLKKISDPNAPTDIVVNTNTIAAMANETGTITATVLPETANQSVTYTSNNTAVVTVDAYGKWTAVGPGTTTITVQTPNGITETIAVTITPAIIYPTAVSVNPTSINTKVGSTGDLKASVLPAGADQTVTYTSSNSSVVTVDAYGKWKANHAGTALITVSTSNGKTAVIPVTVSDLDPDYDSFMYYFGDRFWYYITNEITVSMSSVNIPNYPNQVAFSYILGIGDRMAMYNKDFYATSSNQNVGSITYGEGNAFLMSLNNFGYTTITTYEVGTNKVLDSVQVQIVP